MATRWFCDICGDEIKGNPRMFKAYIAGRKHELEGDGPDNSLVELDCCQECANIVASEVATVVGRMLGMRALSYG